MFSVLKRVKPAGYFSLHRRVVVLSAFVLACGVCALSAAGVFVPADNWLADLRAEISPKPVSGRFVFLGIDNQSIEDVGVWPWPRSVHGQVIRQLDAYNVAEVAVDIDFSTPSVASEDMMLASALAEADVSVVLPVFVQDRSVSADNNRLSVTRPLDMFSANAWLAAVNVKTAEDGIVRNFPLGLKIGGDLVASMPSLIAGVYDVTEENIRINFSLEPQNIPAYSVSDLLEGKIPAGALSGRTVIYGAAALELGDHFAVPVHGSVPGAILQILAAETLEQGIGLRVVGSYWSVIAVLFVSVPALLFAGSGRPQFGTAVLCIFSVLTEITGIWLYREFSLVLPTAGGHILTVLMSAVILTRAFRIQKLRALFAGTGFANAETLIKRIFEDNICGLLIIDETGVVRRCNQRARTFFPEKTIIPDVTRAGDAFPDEMLERLSSCFEASRLGADTLAFTGEMTTGNHETGRRIFEYSLSSSVLEQRSRVTGKQIGEGYFACLTMWDITDRRSKEDRLRYLARYDSMTGALRRSAFDQTVTGYVYDRTPFTVFAVSLRRFKTINMALGRKAGDQALLQTAEAIRNFDAELDDFARIGGDIFAFVIPRSMDENDIEIFCSRLIEEITAPFEIGPARIFVGVHIGVTRNVRSEPGLSLLAEAEHALDEARKVQSNAFVIHRPELSARQNHNRQLESEMWLAVERDEFMLAYQPQFNISDLSVIGAEALIRWNHPRLGSVSPGQFIDIAEANGFVDTLGEWALERACRDMTEVPGDVPVAVNVSPAQFIRTNVPDLVERALGKSGLPPHRLHLEITEVGFLDATDDVKFDLDRLTEMGICLALDDFGTGFSSLGYFANFPISKIKVDQMFVRTLERDSDNKAIIRSVKALSDGLKLKMICEGIETAEQLEILREIGVPEGQGYFYAKPEPFADFLARLSETAEDISAVRR